MTTKHENHLHLVQEAAKELNEANTSLQRAFSSWTEQVTSLHLAAVDLKTAQKRMGRAHELLTDALVSYEGDIKKEEPK